MMERIGTAILQMPKTPLSPTAKKEMFDNIQADIGNEESANIISNLMQKFAITPRLL
jgi:hypothetical protein